MAINNAYLLVSIDTLIHTQNHKRKTNPQTPIKSVKQHYKTKSQILNKNKTQLKRTRPTGLATKKKIKQQQNKPPTQTTKNQQRHKK